MALTKAQLPRHDLPVHGLTPLSTAPFFASTSRFSTTPLREEAVAVQILFGKSFSESLTLLEIGDAPEQFKSQYF